METPGKLIKYHQLARPENRDSLTTGRRRGAGSHRMKQCTCLQSSRDSRQFAAPPFPNRLNGGYLAVL